MNYYIASFTCYTLTGFEIFCLSGILTSKSLETLGGRLQVTIHDCLAIFNHWNELFAPF